MADRGQDHVFGFHTRALHAGQRLLYQVAHRRYQSQTHISDHFADQSRRRRKEAAPPGAKLGPSRRVSPTCGQRAWSQGQFAKLLHSVKVVSDSNLSLYYRLETYVAAPAGAATDRKVGIVTPYQLDFLLSLHREDDIYLSIEALRAWMECHRSITSIRGATISINRCCS